jgi:hypothetical protein
MADPREPLGRVVRETWVAWAREQSDPKPSWLTGWDELDAGQREVDMRIGAALAEAGRAAGDSEVTTEHAIEMSGGGMQVRNSDPLIEKIYPLAQWIPHYQRDGGKVWTRRVIVVEDWTEVPSG